MSYVKLIKWKVIKINMNEFKNHENLQTLRFHDLQFSDMKIISEQNNAFSTFFQWQLKVQICFILFKKIEDRNIETIHHQTILD